jgi:hypothetical protein
MPEGKLHPGVHVALARGRMDEAQTARAMAAGELTSPQHYGNSWLFNLRITGTGGSYRAAHDEYVWRDKSLYLNQGFLDRCNGLPVILEHPNKEMLNTEEYRKRNIGSITYPYIKGDEVWGIARILDEQAAHLMERLDLSTSPAVVFLPRSGNERIDAGDGKHLLIEGKPDLLDHLAICWEGVWDKGGPPAGVEVTSVNRRTDMDEKEKEAAEEKRRLETEEDRVRRDADNAKVDKLLSMCDSIIQRMDAIESRSDLDEEDREKGGENSREDRTRRDEDKDDDPKEKEREEGREGGREDRRRADRRNRRDTDPEDEEKQAEELHELAEEEEQEAENEREERGEEDSKKDRRRSDRADDTEIEKHFMPWENAVRKEGESDSAYSKRMDGLARRHDRNYAKRNDESIAAHCDRVAAGYRKDQARRDAQRRLDAVDVLSDTVGRIAHRLDSLSERLHDRSDEDEAQFAEARSRADQVFEAFGDSSPRPWRGENLVGYRIRLARKLQQHSAAWKDSDLAAIARSDGTAFGNIEQQIYADALNTARKPTSIPVGTLREVRKKLPWGGEIIEFQGSPMAWMQDFMHIGQEARLNLRPGAQSDR